MYYINYRFFIQVASDCETVDQTSHSMSFISDANVLALHRLLWNHQVLYYMFCVFTYIVFLSKLR